MNLPKPYQAIWLSWGRQTFPVLPLRSFIAFGIIIFSLVFLATAVETGLSFASNKREITSPSWVTENQVIQKENSIKIQNSGRSPIFRSLGYSPPQPVANRRRILVIGDSFIWGDGLSNINMTWWRQLQWELERRGYLDVDVVAAGVNGASTQDQYGWLASGNLLESVKPEVVVFGYVTNDPIMRDAKGRFIVLDRSHKEKIIPYNEVPWLRIASSIFPNLTLQLLNRIDQEQAKGKAVYCYPEWELKILQGKNFAEYKLLLRQLAQTLKNSPVPSFFVTTPTAPDGEYFNVRYAPIRKAFESVNLRLIDLLPPLLQCCRQETGGPLLWAANPADGHPGPRMTYFYAKQVADILEKDYSERLGSRSEVKTTWAPKLNDWLPASLTPVQTGLGQWRIKLRFDNLLFMPLEKPHFALNFERPVFIEQIHMRGMQDAKYEFWATILDDQENYELRNYIKLGDGKGEDVSVIVPHRFLGKRITSLRIAIIGNKELGTIDNTLQLKVEFGEGGVQL